MLNLGTAYVIGTCLVGNYVISKKLFEKGGEIAYRSCMKIQNRRKQNKNTGWDSIGLTVNDKVRIEDCWIEAKRGGSL